MNRARDLPCCTTRARAGGRIKRHWAVYRSAIHGAGADPGARRLTDRTQRMVPRPGHRSIKSSYLVHQSRPQGAPSLSSTATTADRRTEFASRPDGQHGPDAAPCGRLFAGRSRHTIRSRFGFRHAAAASPSLQWILHRGYTAVLSGKILSIYEVCHVI